MTDPKKHWLKEYITEKEKDNNEIIKGWAIMMRKHYDAFIDVGFDEQQAIHLVEILWKQVDDRVFKERKERGEFEK